MRQPGFDSGEAATEPAADAGMMFAAGAGMEPLFSGRRRHGLKSRAEELGRGFGGRQSHVQGAWFAGRLPWPGCCAHGAGSEDVPIAKKRVGGQIGARLGAEAGG